MQQTIDLAPLRDLRLTSHLSRRELASAVGVNIVTIWRWEKGLSIPTFTHLVALTRELNAKYLTDLFINRERP